MTGASAPESLGGGHVVQPPYGDWDRWQRWAAEQPASLGLGLTVQEIEDGCAICGLTESVLPLNPNGAAHGGLVAALTDQVGALATATRAPAGHGIVTVNLSLDYLRPAMLPLRVEGHVLRSTRSVIFTRIDVLHDGRRHDQLCATATGSWLVRPYSTPPAEAPDGAVATVTPVTSEPKGNS
ncbi:MAG: PaaI family thioesterase [Nocardioides sp.]|uniref:PaaI family thioesterase n=1 Tax=Nocardioides sp. TaxID=35761 RepID=UPI0039E4A00B